MASIEVCDRCSKHSPDENGRYVSNHWVTIKLYRPFRLGMSPLKKELTVCNDCFQILRMAFQDSNLNTHDANVALTGKA